MKQAARSGSVIVMLLLFFTAVIVCTINIMRSSSYLVDLAHKREQFIQRYWATEGLVRYGVSICKAQSDALLSRAKQQMPEANVVIERWPCGDKRWYGGKIHITTDAARNNHKIRAQLLDEQGDQLFFAVGSTVSVVAAESQQNGNGLASQSWIMHDMHIEYNDQPS